MKRLLSLAIAVCIIIGITTVAPISVGAVETQKVTTGATSGDYQYKLRYDGTAEITKYYGSDTDVTIPSQIDGYTVTTIGDWLFSGCTSLTSITIPDSVTAIGRDAFYGTAWYNNQPDGLVYAGKVAYEYKGECPSEVIIKDGTKGIGGWAFEDCTSLTRITIPNSVTTIGDEAFRNCTSLANITIPDSVTTIGWGAFSDCKSLTSITIPDSVTTIDVGVFSGCTSLTSITIPDSVTSIGYDAFYGTAWYNNQPDGLVYAGKVACKYKGECPSEVIIKDGTKGIGGSAFEYCTSLTSITIPNSVTTIGWGAFICCNSLKSITIGNSVTTIDEYAFSGCESLTSITIPDSVTNIGVRAFEDCKSLTSITIPDSVTTIGSSAFEYCTSLTKITIPDSVTIIGDSAFYNCENLTSITIPDSVTIIGGYAFYGTAWYNNQPDGLVYAGRVAYKYKGECPSEVIIKDGTKSIVCRAFEYCRSLTSITIPDSVITIGDYAFEDCTSLTSITIPDSVTAIGDCAFYKCTSLTSITIPDSVINIGVYAFGYYYISDDDIDIKIDNFIIYGYPNSTAEKYAKNNGFAFLNANKIPITVKKTTVTLAKSSATVYRTGKTAIKATVKNGKGKTTYKSSNTKIAKVTSKGIVTGVSKGTARITVTNNGVKKVFTVKVKNPTLNKNSVSIKKGKTFTLKIAGKIGTAKFTSSNKKIAKVNTKGKITAKKKGKVTIKVKTNGITLVCKVKVK